MIENQCVIIYKDSFVTYEEEIKEEVVFIGEFSTRHYGNFLIDYLCRLWGRNKKQKLIYVSNRLCIEEVPLYIDILRHLQIEKEQLIRITVPTYCAKVLIPEKSMIHDRYITNSYAQIYENIWQAIEPNVATTKWQSIDKVYLTRRKLNKHKEIGERIFEHFFELNGFTVIAPETLSFVQQVALFRNVKEIASIEGTHAHNVIFKGTSEQRYKQIILRKQSEIIPRQIQLNQITNADATWIDVYSEPFKGFPISHDRGPFLLQWNAQIEQFATDNGMLLPKVRMLYNVSNYIEYVFKCACYLIKHTIKTIVYRKTL